MITNEGKNDEEKEYEKVYINRTFKRRNRCLH
jgi:hypothetical protein